MTTPDPTTFSDPIVEFFLEIAKDLGKSFWDITIGRGKKEIDWKISARHYAGEIIKQYGKIRVYGQARPTNLLHTFTDVYLLEKPVALQRYDIDSLQPWFAERERRAINETSRRHIQQFCNRTYGIEPQSIIKTERNIT